MSDIEPTEPTTEPMTVLDVRPYMTERGLVELDLAATRLQWARTQEALQEERALRVELEASLRATGREKKPASADD